MNKTDDNVERHPLQPFLPPNARLLMLGSFPPPRYRWSMDFFYPNRNNQMWEMMGLIFYHDAQRLIDSSHRTFREDDIRQMLIERGIAIFDSATAVRRQKHNASDMLLDVVEPTDIPELLSHLPLCHDIACTGQKSATIICDTYHQHIPPLGEHITFAIEGRTIRLHRVPSTSRAYPMPLEEKATYYRQMLSLSGILSE